MNLAVGLGLGLLAFMVWAMFCIRRRQVAKDLLPRNAVTPNLYLDPLECPWVLLAELSMWKIGSGFIAKPVPVRTSLPSSLSMNNKNTVARFAREKIVDFLKVLKLLKKPEVQEVFVIEEGTKILK